MTNIDEIHLKLTIVHQEEEQQQQKQTNSIDCDHYVARGQKLQNYLEYCGTTNCIYTMSL